MRLKDKVILVTGSTSGIGEGMTRVFAREGARVIVHGIKIEDAKTSAAAIEKDGGRAAAIAGDLRDAAVPARVVELLQDGLAMADAGAGEEEISVALVDAQAGDVVLVHAKEAISVVGRPR